jgi:muconate cycloisomerase
MRITHIDTTIVTATIDPEIMIISSLGSHRLSRYVLVTVHTDEGIAGLGEATVMPGWSGEAPEGTCALVERYFTPELTGQSPFDLERLMHALDRVVVDNYFAKAAIEMALLDIQGKKLGVPVYDLLGGRCRDAAIPVKFVVAATEPDIAVRNAQRMVATGFSTIKIKVGRGSPEADVERVRRVREALGGQVHLTVDANGGWTVADAIQTVRRLEPYDLVLVEQPVRREDIRGMARVRSSVGVPVMADESVFSVADALEVVRQDAADIISVYPGKNGGILKARLIAQIAEASGKPCHVGSNLELEVGSAAMAHLAVSTANIVSERYPADIIGPLYHRDRTTRAPFAVGGGSAHVPEGPGLGVDIDPERVADLAKAT